MQLPRLVLGIETSCDDTSAAVLTFTGNVLSNVVSSQVQLHAEFGGIVPELASRAHIRNIRPVVQESLREAGAAVQDIDLVAVTTGPGLIGSLLVGVNYAKAFCRARGIPLVAVNHLEGHCFSPFLEHPEIAYPLLHLIVSGGHTTIYFSREAGDYEILATTRDDAAGEALDKAAKMLGLPYPGGPVVDRVAQRCETPGVHFALPKISDGSLSFSFSGMKTALWQLIQKENITPVSNEATVTPRVGDLLKGFQAAVIEQLMHRTVHFCRSLRPRSFLLGGGVACNSRLRAEAKSRLARLGIPVYFPSPGFTTDNAAMIARAGIFRFERGDTASETLNADANLRFGRHPAGGNPPVL